MPKSIVQQRLREAGYIDRHWINKRIGEFNRGIIDFESLVDGIAIDVGVRDNPKKLAQLRQHLEMSCEGGEEGQRPQCNSDGVDVMQFMSHLYRPENFSDKGPFAAGGHQDQAEEYLEVENCREILAIIQKMRESNNPNHQDFDKIEKLALAIIEKHEYDPEGEVYRRHADEVGRI